MTVSLVWIKELSDWLWCLAKWQTGIRRRLGLAMARTALNERGKVGWVW
jgi:hypothetical protein